MQRKKIAITMGDAGGIGPEVVLRASFSETIQQSCHPHLIGDSSVLAEAARMSSMNLKTGEVEIIEPYVIKDWMKGSPTADSGKASYMYIKHAVEGCLKGDFHAMVTAPISKEAIRMAGYVWPGHTEMLAELTHTKKYAMMLIGEPLRVILVTTHIPLKDVPGIITKESIFEKIELAYSASKLLGISSPVIAVAGLNPHAGEKGLFGNEEKEIIGPTIAEARRKGMPVEGPIPPDVIFRRAYSGKVDIVIALYHDQGLIPLKMIAFERGVNITIGLPVIRTSPDHGTAYDIAWKGLARPESMIEAIKLAAGLSP
jgi:4-hydroxythreonine-4-phosphate dehydrogenase